MALSGISFSVQYPEWQITGLGWLPRTLHPILSQGFEPLNQ